MIFKELNKIQTEKNYYLMIILIIIILQKKGDIKSLIKVLMKKIYQIITLFVLLIVN